MTYTAPDIMSSAAGSAPFAFTVTATSSSCHCLRRPAQKRRSWNPQRPAAVKPAGVGAAHTYNGGLWWPELDIAQQGMSTSITYTASCNEDHSTVAFTSDTVHPAASDPWDRGGLRPRSGHRYLHLRLGTKGYVDTEYPNPPNAAGNFSCGQKTASTRSGPPASVTTDQTVIVRPTDDAHAATGTGILNCHLFAI